MIKSFDQFSASVSEGAVFMHDFKVGDYFQVTGNMILNGEVQWRQDVAKTRWKTIAVNDTYGGRVFDHGSKSLSKAIVKSIGKEPAYYLKVIKSFPNGVEGLVKFGNGLLNVPYQMSVKAQHLQRPDRGLAIFLKHDAELEAARGTTRFIIGGEDFLYNEDGSKKEDVIPGIYMYCTVDFALTEKFNEPFLYCAPDMNRIDEEIGKKNFLIPVSKFVDLSQTPSDGQADVICKWLSREFDADVYYSPKREWDGSKKAYIDTPQKYFFIPWFSVDSAQGKAEGKGHPGTYRASPFYSREKAQKHIDDVIKRHEEGDVMPFDPKTLRVSGGERNSHSKYEFTFVQLMDYLKIMGVPIDLRKLFSEKRGAVGSKNFGF